MELVKKISVLQKVTGHWRIKWRMAYSYLECTTQRGSISRYLCWLLFVGKGELLIDGNISALLVYILCKELCMTQAEMLPSISNSPCMHNDGDPNLMQVTDKKWLFDKCALIYLVSVPNKICVGSYHCPNQSIISCKLT